MKVVDYPLSDKQQAVIDSLRALDYEKLEIEWTNTSIGPACTLHHKRSWNFPEGTLDITDYETW